MQDNPVDPALSALPGREKRNYLIPAAILGGLVIAAILIVLAIPRGPIPPYYTFENPDLGCRFEYSSELLRGSNYVKTPDGSLLTVERFSLTMAEKTFLAGLPDSLFPQVLIQIKENYTDVKEVSRTHLTVDGHKAVEVLLNGSLAGHTSSVITIDLFANDDWVYVLRSFSPVARDAKERPMFRHVRDTFQIIGPASPKSS